MRSATTTTETFDQPDTAHKIPFAWSILASLLLWAVAIAAFVLLASFLFGCAVGRNEMDGSIVLGFKAGQLVETANQAIASAGQIGGDMLPAPWGKLLTLGALGFSAHLSGQNRGYTQAQVETAGLAPLAPKSPQGVQA